MRIFKVSSLKLYCNTLAFLAKEILRDDPEYFFFLLPNARKLFDVYARFIHLLKNCSTESQRALSCTAYQLMSYHSLNNQVVFDQTLSNCKNFIAKEKYQFPSFKDFNYTWYLRKSGLAFNSNRDLLEEWVIIRYTNPPIKVFKGQDLIGLYGMVSELCHGNPYFNYKGAFNERFWIATMSLMVTSYLIDLIDTYTLKKPLRRDFREWMSDTDKVSRDIVALWVARKNPAN